MSLKSLHVNKGTKAGFSKESLLAALGLTSEAKVTTITETYSFIETDEAKAADLLVLFGGEGQKVQSPDGLEVVLKVSLPKPKAAKPTVAKTEGKAPTAVIDRQMVVTRTVQAPRPPVAPIPQFGPKTKEVILNNAAVALLAYGQDEPIEQEDIDSLVGQGHRTAHSLHLTRRFIERQAKVALAQGQKPFKAFKSKNDFEGALKEAMEADRPKRPLANIGDVASNAAALTHEGDEAPTPTDAMSDGQQEEAMAQ